MMNWDTGDKVVNRNLYALEGYANWREDSDAGLTDQLVGAMINLEEMMPKAIRIHFKLPNLFIGDAHFRNDQEYRAGFIKKLNASLSVGLESAAADPTLNRGGGADFSDRPKSRGEVILDALGDYERTRDQSAMARLKDAVSPTRLQSRVQSIEMLRTRKRTYGNQSPEVATLSELHRLRYEAEGYFGLKA